MLVGIRVSAGAATVIDNADVAVCAGLEESVTLAVKLKAPEAVGVPEICPLVDRLRPVGNWPEASDQL